MHREISIGIVGCGHVAAAHLASLRELNEKGELGTTMVRALCDREQWKAESLMKRGEGPDQQPGTGPSDDPVRTKPVWVSDFQGTPKPEIYTDYHEMLRKADVNTVLVLSPVSTHHEIALAALKAGKNVLVEKPFAVSMRAARLVAEAAKLSGLMLGVAESFHYLPLVRIIRWLIDEGYAGDVQMSYYGAAGGYWAPDRILGETSWRHKKVLAGGGVTADAIVHIFHELRYIVGEVVEVCGYTQTVEPLRSTRDAAGTIVEQVDCETDDTMTCALRFENGSIGTVFYSWAGRGIKTDLPSTFYCRNGCIRDDSVFLEGQKPARLADFFQNNANVAAKERLFPCGITRPFTLEMLDFLTAVRNGGQMETSGEQGLSDLAVSYAVLESSLLGKAIKVADILSGTTSSYENDINLYFGI